MPIIRIQFRRLIRYISYAILAGSFVLFALDRWVSLQTDSAIIQEGQPVPHFNIALVLGTSKYLGRTLNDYYAYRINAAIKLYKEGKVNYFLLSGDNAHRSYNEPWTMKRDLIKAGVPDQRIYLDYAGFSTLDSVVRAKEVFGADHFLIISQNFHCERALYIAQHRGIHATCLAVPGPTEKMASTTRFREVFARVKAFLDLFILDAQPKFLGPKISITTPDSTPHEGGDQHPDNPILNQH